MENNQLRCTSVQNMKMVQHCCRFAQNLKHENNEFVLFIFINKKISERSAYYYFFFIFIKILSINALLQFNRVSSA